VAAIQQECVDVLSFVFESEERSPLPSALPGQFLAFKIGAQGGSAPLLRSYSLSGPQDAGTYRISVKRAGGAGSRYFHDHVQAGDLLHVSAPRGSFTVARSVNPVVLLSAGIGATPVLSMLHSFATGDASSMREVWWCYGARNGREHPFAAEVRDLLKGLSQSHSIIAYSKPEEEDRPEKEYDMAGHLNISTLQQLQVPKTADFYLCGPPAFLAEFKAALKAWGVADSTVHFETFGAESSITPGIATVLSRTPHPPADRIGTGPNVLFTRSGLTVPWDSRFGSLLEFAETCDVPVRWSCRVGVCHTCESGLIGGNVGYAPEPIEHPLPGNILICCSAPRSDIELDL
jgi:ferredoxin-NADP reductase/ferredoxin